MSDQAFRESSNDLSAGDIPTGDPLRVGRGLVEDVTESGRTDGRTVTDDGALDSNLAEQAASEREVEREGSAGRASLAHGGLGAHVMDAHGTGTDSPDTDDE